MADLGFADEESNFDNESVMGGAAGDDHDETSSTLNRAPKRSLTEIEDEADQQEQETPAGTDDDEKEEDEDEEESEDEDREDRPRKKKRRKRAGNQFLDIEADVDEDEDEEEDEEDGFVAANDDFIVKSRDQNRGLQPSGDDDLGDYGEAEIDVDGDASHRLLDRRRMAKRDKEAAELAASFHDRYGKANYDAEGAEEWAPKALLMPGVNDPSIWGVRCKTGRERDLVLSLSRKAAALALSDNASPLRIISAFQRDSIKGYLYIEARAEDHVRKAIDGLIGVYANSPNGVFLVDIEEMPDLLKTKQKKVEINPGGWARIKRGKYAGDLAQIIDMSENGEDVLLKFIPRIDLTPKDEGLSVGPDGKKRKKGAGAPLAFRPPQRFFNADEISKIYGKRDPVVKRAGGVLTFKNDTYNNGYCEKDIRISGLTLEDVQPTIDELTRFLGDSGATGADGEPTAGLDLSQVADAARKAAKSILQPGDHVEIFEGDQRGMYGTVDSISNDVVQITPHADLDLDGHKVEVQARSVRKRFKAGDHVKVMNGSNADETGLVVKVKDDIVTFLSDLSMQEVDVFTKDVREAAEVGAGVNVIGQYELHDLVQLDSQTTGVIFKIERDLFRILDQSGAVRNLKPSQISNKVFSRNAVATDHDGYDIKQGDEMKEVGGNTRDGRTGRILHVYRSMFAFLFNRDVSDNGGVFVSYARNLTSTAPRGHKAKPGTTLNPELFGVAQVPQQASNNGRPDGRIHRKVSVTKGAWKGYAGVVKDVTAGSARVELHTNSKVITIPVQNLKEMLDDGKLIPLLERKQGEGYGGRQHNFSRESSTFSTASNQAPLGQPNMSGRTPFPAYGGRTPAPAWSGGRTPAPQAFGGATPAYGGGATPGYGGGGGGATPGYGANGRTPGYAPNPTARSNAWAPDSRTPAHPSMGGAAAGGRPNDSWNPSSRTPGYPSSRTPAHPSMGAGYGAPPAASSSADPWNASSRTPYHPGLAAVRAADGGGRTPDPRAGARTPAYGAKSGYGYRQDDRGEGSSNQPMSAPTPAAVGAPTPAADMDGDDGWGVDSAPTPAASKSHDYGGPQAKTPYEAPTPYAGAPTPAAPTPAAYTSQYAGAPTPAPYGAAPTPGAYPSGPTPGAYAAVATPGGYGTYQTPGTYAGAATAAAQPMEYQPRMQEGGVLPEDWIFTGIRVIFADSDFQKNRLTGQFAAVQKIEDGLSTLSIDSNKEVVKDVPTSALKPMGPYRPNLAVIVLSGKHRGARATTQSRDGTDWMVQVDEGLSMVIDAGQLAQVAEAQE